MGNGEKIKVCYVLPEYSENLDSHIFYLYDFVSRAAERLDIYLIVEKSQVKNLNDQFKFLRVQRFRFGPLRWLENLFLIVSAGKKGYKNFYSHYSYFGAINSIIVSKIFGGRTFYWSCGMMWLFEKPLKNGLYAVMSKLKDEWPLRFILKHIDYLVTGNETMKREYCRHYKILESKVKIMPNWIDLERFDPEKFNRDSLKKKYNLPSDKRVILFVHHLSERKGADLLPQIAAGFKGRKDIIFVVCGRGPYEAKLKDEIRNKGLSDLFRLEGAVSNKLIPEYFAVADVFLMPSREEGFPRVLLESMAMNVPFVASDVGGVREMTPPELQHTIMAKNENGAEYAADIMEILKNSPLQLRAYAQNFSAEKVLEIFINLFK